MIALLIVSVYNMGKYMEQENKEYTVVADKKLRLIVDIRSKNWKRISFNDFGVKYSQDFVEVKKKEKKLWKNLFLQKSMIGLKEE